MKDKKQSRKKKKPRKSEDSYKLGQGGKETIQRKNGVICRNELAGGTDNRRKIRED